MLDRSPVTLAFNGPITVDDITAARWRILTALAESDVLTIDCSLVDDADTDFADLLLQASGAALTAGKVFRLVAPASGPLHDMLGRGMWGRR